MSEEASTRIDRLLDAIELVKANRRDEALPILRELIREDSDFEDAWLWMSLAVESVDQSILCLDNVLRVNPKNWQAAGALHRLRENEIAVEARRAALRYNRDLALLLFWLLVMVILLSIIATYIGYGRGA